MVVLLMVPVYQVEIHVLLNVIRVILVLERQSIRVIMGPLHLRHLRHLLVHHLHALYHLHLHTVHMSQKELVLLMVLVYQVEIHVMFHVIRVILKLVLEREPIRVQMDY